MISSQVRQQTDFINAADAQTLPGLFEARVARSPDKVAYQQYDETASVWRNYTWGEMQHRVGRWRAALLQEQLSPVDRVAVILKNSIDWVCFDQAAQSLGMVVVSLYTTDTPANLAYILADAGARLVLVGTLEQWQDIAAHRAELPLLKRVWCIQPEKQTATRNDIIRFTDDILPAEPVFPEPPSIDPHALATLIYTSGTTGRPKGVMLSHQNILSNAESVHRLIPAYPEDVFLSFLPLAHGFERTVEYYLPMMAGSSVSYARSVALLREDLPIIRPTVFISAPRLYEKIYAAVQEKISSDWLKRKLFDSAVSLGWQQFEVSQKIRSPLNPITQLAWRVLHRLVAEKILSRLGGRLRIAVTGAAPMSEKIALFFLALGVPLLEGYGLTEAGPVVSANRPDNNVPGSVGKPLPGVEVKLSEHGELLVRSASVMLGYWQREEATRRTIDDDGWLYTGDLAEITAGRIYLRGRIKEILVTSTGENVAPADMEMAITLDPLFEQAMVVGEGKPFLVALLVLNPNAWARLAGKLHLDATDEASLYHQNTTAAVLNELNKLLGHFPGYAQIRAVYLCLEPWSIEDGSLTPTLKIKRDILAARFAQQIDELYRGHVIVN